MNPFYHRGPIRASTYFYGRDAQVKEVLDMLRNGQSVSVSGPRKIGKTSLLYHVSRPNVMQRHGLDPAEYLFVYLDCEGVAGLTIAELYTMIVEEVVHCAGQQGHMLENPDHTVPYLAFRSVLRQMANLDHPLRVVLLLDELGVLSDSSSLCSTLFPPLRALATESLITFLVASQRPLVAYARDDYSPFYNIFAPVPLGLLNESECRALMAGYLERAGAALSPEILSRILTLSGRHPFWLQVLGYHALEYQTTAGRPLGAQDADLVAQRASIELEPHLAYHWERLDTEEQYALTTLVFAQKNVAYRMQLRALASHCLIVEKDKAYACFTPLLLDFVRRQEVAGVLQKGPLVLAQAIQSALLDEEPLRLSPRVFDLLSYLIEQAGRVVSVQELDREVWNQSTEFISDARVKSAIRDLRRALGEHRDWIVNVPGVGYALRIGREE